MLILCWVGYGIKGYEQSIRSFEQGQIVLGRVDRNRKLVTVTGTGTQCVTGPEVLAQLLWSDLSQRHPWLGAQPGLRLAQAQRFQKPSRWMSVFHGSPPSSLPPEAHRFSHFSLPCFPLVYNVCTSLLAVVSCGLACLYSPFFYSQKPNFPLGLDRADSSLAWTPGWNNWFKNGSLI